MLNIIKILFGLENSNRVKIWLGTAQRNPIANKIVTFLNRYYYRWNNTDPALIIGVRVAMVTIPLANMFLFSGLFTFLFLVSLDILFISFVMATKIPGKGHNI